MPPICPAMFMPMNAIAGPAFWLLAAACIAAACAPTICAAARVGSINAALRCISLSIFSSSSFAFTDETPNDTISRPRSLRHLADSTSLSASAISIV